jgi:trimeric autotransporter adhesin
MLRSLKFVCLLAAVAIVAAAFPAAGAPVLSGISPASGYPGTQVTYTGTGFGATQGTGSVWLGNKLAGSIVSWSNTQIVAVVAATAASGSASVQQGGWSNSIAFTVIKPNVTGVSPASGYPGTQVTITGTSFGATQGTGSVWLGNKLAGSIVSWSATQIVATVASTALSGSVQVQQMGVWSNSVAFTVVQPNITSITPTTGGTGTQVTFTGTNFGATQGTGSVWLGSKLAGSIVSWSDTQIVATVASGSITGNAFVQQGGVWSNSIPFTVVTPTLTSVSPDTGRAGDEITLTGTNFGATQGTGSVWLGSKLAGSIVSWSDTQIVATIASGAISGTAQVQRGGVWTTSIPFTVITPVIQDFSHYEGAPVGAEVTIYGEGFGATQGGGLVWLGTKYASVVSWSDTAVVAIVPANTASGTIQVFQNGVWSNANFTFTLTGLLEGLEVDEFVPGGASAEGWVYLSEPAPAGGVTVALSSSEASVTVPSSVTVPEGEDSVSFTIATQEVPQLVQATITATHGAIVLHDAITVFPPALQFMELDEDHLHNTEVSTGTVILYAPAPAGGVDVNLTSANPALVEVPATVHVEEGEMEASFSFQVYGPVTEVTEVEIIAELNGFDDGDPVYVLPPGVVDLDITPTTATGGEEVTVTVTLSDPAAAGTTIEFDSTDDALPPPDPIVLAEGATSAQATIQLGYVDGERTEVLTATIEGSPGESASVTILPLELTLESVSVSPEEVIGSNPATFTVTLTEPAPAGGLEVDLYHTSIATMAPFVVVPEGEISASVPVETFTHPNGVLSAPLEGYHLGTARRVWIQVLAPPANYVTSLTFAESPTAGGNLVTATVTLDSAAGAGGAVIALESDNLAVATVPATVTVLEGNTTATFDVDTDAVVQPADAVIRATYNDVIARKVLTVVPTPSTVALESLSFEWSTVVGGNDATATVTLSDVAPAGGITITLGGSRAGLATVPATVTVPAGESSATFTVTTQHWDRIRYARVTAAYDNLVRSADLKMIAGLE